MTGMAKAASSVSVGATVRPTPETVAAARTSPSSMLPESPMKIRAGLKLYGRNPMAAPTTMIENSEAGEGPSKTGSAERKA